MLKQTDEINTQDTINLNNKLLQPHEIAKLSGINRNTLNTYLRDKELFPPEKEGEYGYRYYPETILEDLKLFKTLRKKPFRLTIAEIKPILIKHNVSELLKLHDKSKHLLFDFLNK